MTDEEIVARALDSVMVHVTIRTGVSDLVSQHDPADERWMIARGAATRAVVAALREAGRLVPEGVTVRYGWQSGDSSPAAWSASRVAVDQP